MQADSGIQLNHESSRWEWMPRCPLSVGTSPKHYGGDGFLMPWSAIVGGQLMFSLGYQGCPGLSVDKTR